MIVDPRWSRRESEEAWKRAAQTLAEDLRAMTRERDEARAERDALIGAGCSVEQNALALLDLYAERERHATTERDAARAEVSRAEYERDLVRAEIDRRTDWYQQRFQTLREWVNNYIRPISEEAYQRYWNIAANGSPAPHERSDWTLTMHGLTLRAEGAERQRDMARAEVERLLLERNAAVDDNARLRLALQSCADIGEARVAKVVRDALTQDFEHPGDSVVTAGDLIGLRRT